MAAQARGETATAQAEETQAPDLFAKVGDTQESLGKQQELSGDLNGPTDSFRMAPRVYERLGLFDAALRNAGSYVRVEQAVAAN